MRHAGGKTAGKDKEKENKFNLFTVTVLCRLQQNAEFFSVSQGPAFVHREVRSAGSQQTLIALRPKAATFKQGHSSSHGKGKWSLALILNHPPPRRSVQGHQRSSVTASRTYIGINICRQRDRRKAGRGRWHDE